MKWNFNDIAPPANKSMAGKVVKGIVDQREDKVYTDCPYPGYTGLNKRFRELWWCGFQLGCCYPEYTCSQLSTWVYELVGG